MVAQKRRPVNRTFGKNCGNLTASWRKPDSIPEETRQYPAFYNVKIKYLTEERPSCILDGMDKLYEQTLLYDFYGELLTDHQKQIYEEVVMNDYSLSEVAREYDISRQGVHDLIRRIDKSLEEYEEKAASCQTFPGNQEQD
jgi:predicted DNA-binding protein YlxM (UPF0122 family)